MSQLKCLFSILGAMVLVTPLFAQEKMSVGQEAQTDLMVTVYNNGYGLVREVREFEVPVGTIELEFKNVAELIDPTSVAFKSLTAPDQVSIFEQNYRYDLLTPQSMLDHYVGKRVTLIQQIMENNTTTQKERAGTLLSNNGGTVVRFEDGSIETNPYGFYRFEQVPGDLMSDPTLVWLIGNKQAGKHKVETSYLTNGMTWKADYVAVVNETDTKLDLTGWVTLDNQSGASFGDAQLKLVAGDVQRVQDQYPRAPEAMMAKVASAEMDQGGFSEKSFFEYHLYTLGRRTTLAQKETKQMSLLEGANIGVKKVYVFQTQPLNYRNAGWQQKQKVAVKLEFDNSEANNLGMPMPKGKVRVYKADSDASLLLIGEDLIDHTPRDEKLTLKMGEAFDIVAEARVTDYTHISNNVFRLTASTEIRNHKAEDIEVVVLENVYGDWKMIRTNRPEIKRDAQTMEFRVPVRANDAATLEYTVEVTY